MTSRPEDLVSDQGGFDEAWYLAQHPSVAEAVRIGQFASGWAHFDRHGRGEGLLPGPGLLGLGLRPGESSPFWEHNGPRFLTPHALAVSETPLRRVAMIGSCLLEGWGLHRKNPSNCPVDLYTMNHLTALSAVAPDAIAAYDFAVVQVPIRYLQRDDAVWHYPYDDKAAHEAALRQSCEAMEQWLDAGMAWNRDHGLLTFVVNFLVPQNNPMGRLFPRFDVRNPEYFFTRLNEHLETIVRQHRNAYVLDIDRLSASMGRRHTQEDSVNDFGHGAFFPIAGRIAGRIEPIEPMSAYYDIRWQGLMPKSIWGELLAMYRTIRQTDMVKLVVVDLDDTLWHGVSGDKADSELPSVEGYPLGLVEALQYLRRRGILLGLISKNDEGRIWEIWSKVFNGGIRLEDFAAIRINWRPKPENMREILTGMNLLPGSVVFIDDNPAERTAIQQAFPGIRVLGRHPYYLRRILLWAPETQTIQVTEESSRRTEMIQAQFRREELREEVPRAVFLRNASPKIALLSIESTAHPRFARVSELINKTNQFNTTSRRWAHEEFEAWFANGGRLLAFDVTDTFTHYGLVGAVLFKDAAIEQWVMSCRVLGYEIEQGVMAVIVGILREAGAGAIAGRLVRTNVNFPCQDLFSRCGFEETGSEGQWVLSAEVVPSIPDHLTIPL